MKVRVQRFEQGQATSLTYVYRLEDIQEAFQERHIPLSRALVAYVLQEFAAVLEELTYERSKAGNSAPGKVKLRVTLSDFPIPPRGIDSLT